MKKDILTTEKIKTDYRNQFLSSIKPVIVMPIILVLLIAFIVFLFSLLEFNILFLIWEIIIIFPPAFYAYICIAALIDACKDNKAIEKDLFIIKTDTLINSEEKATYVGSAFISSFSHPYILEFKTFGKYCIPVKNYGSSNLYDMSDKGVYNLSNIGDTFYLILDSKNKILLAYNTKLFEISN